MASSYEQQIRVSADISPAERAVGKLTTGLSKIEKLAKGSLDGLKNTRLNFDTRGAEQQISRLKQGIAGLNQRVRVRVEEVYSRATGGGGSNNGNNSSGFGAATLASTSKINDAVQQFQLLNAEIRNLPGNLNSAAAASAELVALGQQLATASTTRSRAEQALREELAKLTTTETAYNAQLQKTQQAEANFTARGSKNRQALETSQAALKRKSDALEEQRAAYSRASSSVDAYNQRLKVLQGRITAINSGLAQTKTKLPQQFGPKDMGTAAGAGLAFANIPGQSVVQAAGAGALVAGPKGAIAAGLVATGVAATQAGGKIASFYAEVLKGRQALAGISTSNADYAASIRGIQSVVEDFNAPIAETTRAFTQLRASTAAVGLDAAETTKVYRALAAANVALGGDSERLQGILLATSQIFSKNKVSAEELRGQLGERLAGAFADFARAGGQSTAQLDAALKKGEVSLSDFLKFTDYVAKKYEKNAMALADASTSAGDRLKTAWQNLQVAIGPLLQDIGAKFQNFATSVVNFLTPVIAKVTELLGLSRQSQNDRLFNVRAEIAKIDETLRKIPEGQRRISAGLQDANGNLIGAGVDVGARLRAERAALVKEERRLTAALNQSQKTGGQKVPRDLTYTDLEQQEKDRNAALEEAARLNADINTELGAQLQAEFELRAAGKSTYQQLVLKAALLEKLANLQYDSIYGSTDDPTLKLQQLTTAQKELEAETAKLKQGYADLQQELYGVVRTAFDAVNALTTSSATGTESPLQAQLRGVKEEVQQTITQFTELEQKIQGLAAGGEDDPALKPLLDNFKSYKDQLPQYNDPKLQNRIASQKLTQGDLQGMQEQQRALQLQIAALKQGRTELTGMEELLQRYGADWANLDEVVKGHLVGLARTNDALQKQLEKVQQLRQDAESLSGITVNGIQEALVASVTGGDVRAAFSSMFSELGNQFLTMGLRPVQQWLTQEIAKLLGLTLADATQTAAITANTGAVAAASTAVTTTVIPVVTANTSALAANTAALAANTAAQAASSTTSAVSGAVGGFDWAGLASSAVSAFGGGFSAGGVPDLPGLSGLGALNFRAAGGPITAGQPYIVGEQGPELVLPRQPGTVINASDTAAALSHYSPGRATALRQQMEAEAAGGGGAGGSSPITLNVTATRIADDNWVKVNDLQVALAETRRQAAAEGAKAGEVQTLRRLQNSPGTRRKLGL